jgi:hypothetical protein
MFFFLWKIYGVDDEYFCKIKIFFLNIDKRHFEDIYDDDDDDELFSNKTVALQILSQQN